MSKTISATDAVRQFSALLSQVGFRRQRYTITRGGKAVADLGPAAGPVAAAATPTLGDLTTLLTQLPRLGEEAAAFRRDVERGIRRAPTPPKRSTWG
jgi:antitoxin (DNA-binding transcriptional repressor) of toxin-antitoxin stability system